MTVFVAVAEGRSARDRSERKVTDWAIARNSRLRPCMRAKGEGDVASGYRNFDYSLGKQQVLASQRNEAQGAPAQGYNCGSDQSS